MNNQGTLLEEVVRASVEASLEQERESLARLAEKYEYHDFAKEIRARNETQ